MHNTRTFNAPAQRYSARNSLRYDRGANTLPSGGGLASPLPTISYSTMSTQNKKLSWCWQQARRRFYDIRLQKISWPWNGGQRSLKVI